MIAQPISEITASSVAEAFINTWVTSWGVPLHVITDRGRQFESELFSEVAKIIGFYRLRTTAYHPHCNGLIERMHRTIKTAILARKESWFSALPIVLLGIRSMPNSTQCLLPQLLIDSISEAAITQNFTKDLHKTTSQFDVRDFTKRVHKSAKSYVPEKLQTRDKVWIRVDRVRRPLEALYSGPYTVLQRTPKYFLVKINNDMDTQVSVDRLKPYIKVQKQIVEKQVEEKMNNRKTLSDSEQEINARNKTEDSPMINTKSRSGRTVSWKKHNEYYYY